MSSSIPPGVQDEVYCIWHAYTGCVLATAGADDYINSSLSQLLNTCDVISGLSYEALCSVRPVPVHTAGGVCVHAHACIVCPQLRLTCCTRAVISRPALHDS
jgi:hypothetical protein